MGHEHGNDVLDYTGSGGLVECVVADLFCDDEALAKACGDGEQVEKMRVLWRTAAGKSWQAAELSAMLPDHDTYSEPFAGSAAVFFAKQASKREVLNDANPEVADALRFVQSCTDGEIEQLHKQKWHVKDRAAFEALRKFQPKGRVAQFHRFLLIKLVSFFGQGRGLAAADNASRLNAQFPPVAVRRLALARERLKGVEILCGDYQDAARKADGPGTVHFMDPPYPGFDQEVGEERFDEADFCKFAKTLKGKVLITYSGKEGNAAMWKAAGFRVQTKQIARSWTNARGPWGGTEPMLIVSNFKGGVAVAEDHKVSVSARAAAIFGRGREAARGLRDALKKMDAGFALLDVPAVKEADTRPADLLEVLQAAVGILPMMKKAGGEQAAEFAAGVRELADLLWCERADLDELVAGLAKAVELDPKPDFTVEEKRESQAMRARKWGITPLEGEGERLVFPPGWSTTLEDYGDPVNLMYPCDTVERARDARARFKQFADRYPKDEDRKIVHTRIVEHELRHGVKPAFDPDDPLDAMLPEAVRAKLTKGDGDDLERMDVTVKEAFAWKVEKADEGEERFVLGFVLRPGTVDKQGDTYSAADVRKAMFSFMMNGHVQGLIHREKAGPRAVLIENYQAPADFTIKGSDTASGKDVQVRKGDWLQGWFHRDDELWAKVKRGELTGFSIGGWAKRTPTDKPAK